MCRESSIELEREREAKLQLGAPIEEVVTIAILAISQ